MLFRSGPLPPREKEFMLELEELAGQFQDFWTQQVSGLTLNVLFAFLSPDIPEMRDIDLTDPFITWRILAKLEQNFKQDQLRDAPRLNHEILDFLKTFSKAVASKTDVIKFFQKLQELRSLATSAKIHTLHESFIVSDLAEQLINSGASLQLQLLGIQVRDKPISLNDFETLTKNKCDQPKVDSASSSSFDSPSTKSESIEVQKDVALLARIGNMRDRFRKGQEPQRFSGKSTLSGKQGQGIQKKSRKGKERAHI